MSHTPHLFRPRFTLTFAVLALWSSLFAESASAQLTLTASAGIFDAWQGEGNEVFRGGAGATFGRDKRFRLLGEFAYREFETEIFGVEGIEVESYQIAVVFHYRLLPDAPIQPYIGARTSVAVNEIDDDAIERAKRGFARVDDTGSSVGLAAILGVEVPIGEHFFLFAEADVGVEIQFTVEDDDRYDDYYDDDYEVDSEQIGGVHGVAGVRVVF